MSESRKLQKRKSPLSQSQSDRWQEWSGPSLITNYGNNSFATLLNHELRCPWLNAVDILCSYIKQPGLGQLWDSITNVARYNRAVPVRIITTTQHQLTEFVALRELSNLPNVGVKVVISDKPTFHAKSWLFKRACQVPQHGSGCSCAYVAVVGSSNMSVSALTTGFEWNVRLTGTPRLGGMSYETSAVDDFAATFNHYWTGGDPFWSDLRNVVPFDSAQQLVQERLQKFDPSKCEDPNCQMCIAHSQHIRQKQASRPTYRTTRSQGSAKMQGSLAQYGQPSQASPQSLVVTSPRYPTENDRFVALYAASHGHKEWLPSNLGVNYRENDFGCNGSSLLHCAAYGLHLDLVRYLIEECGADVNMQDDYGNTPLNRAAQSSPYLRQFGNDYAQNAELQREPQKAMVKYLLSRGADPSKRNRYNLDPWLYCNALSRDLDRLSVLTPPHIDPNLPYPEGIPRVFQQHKIQYQPQDNQSYMNAVVALLEQCRYPKWEDWGRRIRSLNLSESSLVPLW